MKKSAGAPSERANREFWKACASATRSTAGSGELRENYVIRFTIRETAIEMTFPQSCQLSEVWFRAERKAPEILPKVAGS
jgi:hypothetical protein